MTDRIDITDALKILKAAGFGASYSLGYIDAQHDKHSLIRTSIPKNDDGTVDMHRVDALIDAAVTEEIKVHGKEI
jgi:hypothetical protein